MEEWLNSLDLQQAEPSGRSKHERLRDHLVNEMRVGGLMPGQALPSQREMVEALGVAHMTIRQAMACLENEGLVRRVQGKGTFVESDVRRKLQRGQDIFALVAPDTRSGFYPSLVHGFETAASDLHHQTMICSTAADVARQGDIMLQLIDKEVGGVAMVPTIEPLTPAYQIRQLQKHAIPVVFCHRRVEGITAPLLSLSTREVGCVAGKALVEQGHRRVAFAATYYGSSVSRSYEEGLREGLRSGGGDIPGDFVCRPPTIEVREEDVRPSLERWFAAPNPPTAIFATFDSLAEVLYLVLPRLGLRVPQDVSLIGFGGAAREGALMRRLTSVVVDEVATGRQAVSLLHEMRRGDRAIDDGYESVMSLSLSEGETLAPPNHSGTR
jgi:GntR family transcriptional regulator, arabinose operon transcriptional repressor